MGTGFFENQKRKARQLKVDIYALGMALRDPRVPWPAKALCACVFGYALSPIDLIPDFIPVLGYLDDLIILPLGFWVAVKMIPDEVFEECREKARAGAGPIKTGHRFATAVIVFIWLLGLVLLVGLLRQLV